jgi:hypothetical protein
MATSSDGVVPPGQQPAWLTRHWKWAVVLGCLGLVILVAMFVGTILTIVEHSFQHSDAYIYAVTQARTNPLVGKKIGSPLKVGWLATGNINISGPSGNANLGIPIAGPQGRGTIYVVAKKSAGTWQFETLQVEVAGEQQRIDLLPQEQKVPIEQ